MVIGEAVAGLTGAHALWGYNRKNYMYDREMRQEQEFQILEWRNRQAELWREDVRDLIGLTQKKMDNYLIVCTLQLGMCVMMFTEGRLEPGTPHWLLRLYMLTLGAAFMYLLMAIWLAMHASVVAQSSSARLLTQLVRLPVPTWEQLEAMRTYGASFETLGWQQMLRCPFVQPGGPAGATPPKESRTRPAPAKKPGPSSGDIEAPAVAAADPWGLEREGDDIYELQQQPTATFRHVELVKRAAAQYQCYDAFARVAMTLGTNQMLFALTYYGLGYVMVQDGAPWPAWGIAVVMVCLAVSLIELDVSLTKRERLQARVLMSSGPAFASVACCAYSTYTKDGHTFAHYTIPPIFVFQGLWLQWVLTNCAVQTQPNGAILPTKFRTVLYLDVFGWLYTPAKGKKKEDADRAKPPVKQRARTDSLLSAGPVQEALHRAPRAEVVDEVVNGGSLSNGWCSATPAGKRHPEVGPKSRGVVLEQATSLPGEEDLRKDLALWESDYVQDMLDESEQRRVKSIAEQFQRVAREPRLREPPGRGVASQSSNGEDGHRPVPPLGPPPPPARWLKLHGYSDMGVEVPYLYNPQTTEVRYVDSPEDTPASRAWGEPAMNRDTSSLPMPLSLSFTEARVQSFCARADARACCPSGTEEAAAAAQHDARSGEPRLPPQKTALPGKMPSLLEWCEGHQPTPSKTSGPPEGASSPDGLHPAVKEGRNELRHGMVYPQPGDGTGHRPKRPEDIDAHHAEQTYHFHRSHLLHDHDPTGKKPVRGVGPAGSVPDAHHETFHPVTYFPRGRAAADDEHLAPDAEVVTGHDKALPGKAPWTIFRNATRLLVFCWAIAFAISIPQLNNIVGFHTVMLPIVMEKFFHVEEAGRAAAMGHDVNVAPLYGIAEARASKKRAAAQRRKLSELPGGYEVKVEWPRQYSFRPRSLSVDPLGRKLLVADEFGIFVAKIGEVERRLAAANASDSESAGDARATFVREPLCAALLGQPMKDASLDCSGSVCRVIALSGRGRQLAECPMSAKAGDFGRHIEAEWLESMPLLEGAAEPDSEPLADRWHEEREEAHGRVWELSGSWLNVTQEHVESMAVSGGCGAESTDDGGLQATAGAAALGAASCILVGTSEGRLLRLRPHARGGARLVPEWALPYQASHTGRGSLHAFPGGGRVLSLHSQHGFLQVFDVREGSRIAEWKLPQGVAWSAVTGSADNIFLLGRRHQSKAAGVIWRFPLPAELKSWQTSDADGRGSHLGLEEM